MSEDKSVSNATPDSGATEEEKEAFVSKKAYEEVSSSMHKHKSKAKELEAAVNELRAQMKAQEEAKLQETQQYKELYERREAELEAARKEAAQVKNQYLVTAKRNALKQELGGKVKDEYLSFADLESIAVSDDGSIDAEAVRMVANEFRKQHSQLIPATDNANITGQAPGNFTAQKPDTKNMSAAELREYLIKNYSN
jgi:hypothetical protein